MVHERRPDFRQDQSAKRKWVKPEVKVMKAGSAELTVGQADDNVDLS